MTVIQHLSYCRFEQLAALYVLHHCDASCEWYVINDTWDIQMS